jgi:hypothetical protein
LPDPDVLDELPEDKWRYWQALALVDDWGHDRVADLAAAIHNSLMLVAAKLGGHVTEQDLNDEQHYQRKFRWERPQIKLQTADEQLAILRGMTRR